MNDSARCAEVQSGPSSPAGQGESGEVFDSPLPTGWADTTIGEILATLDDGRTLHQGWSPRCEKEPSLSDEQWGVLKTTAIQDGEFQPQHNKRLPDHMEPRPKIEVREGDLLITCAGPRIRCGVPCLVRSTRPRLLMSGKMYRFRAPDGIDPVFFEALLRSPTLQSALNKIKTGIDENGLNLTHARFRDLGARLAPKAEQIRIVSAIESLQERSARAKQALCEVGPLLSQLRQSVLRGAFSGRLTERWRTENTNVEPASELLARIRTERRERWEAAQLAKYEAKGKQPPKNWQDKYKEPEPVDESELPEIPPTWEYTKIDVWLSQSRPGIKTGPFGSLLKKHEHQPTGVPVLGIENIGEMKFVPGSKIHITEDKANDLETYDVQPGDLLISRSGTVGEVCVAPDDIGLARFSTNIMRVVLAEGGMLPAFLGFIFDGSLLVKNQISKLCAGSTRDFLNKKILESLVIPVPPLEEQSAILEAIYEGASGVQRVETVVASSEAELTQLDQSILAKAFRGELVPQDPSDEPASQLLHRIRTTRAQLEAEKKAAKKKSKKKATRKKNSKV